MWLRGPHADRGTLVACPGPARPSRRWSKRHRRATALAARDEDTLRAIMLPDLPLTNYRGDVLDYEEYIEGNVRSRLVWHAQCLEDIGVVVVGDTAALTAPVPDEVEPGRPRPEKSLSD